MRVREGKLVVNVQVSAPLPAQNSSLVIVGAHRFGKDNNDPLFASVNRLQWSAVLLIEASPVIADQLHTQFSLSKKLLPRVPRGNITVVGEGVCPDGAGDGTKRPFYSVEPIAGLPDWSSMIGSFDREHVLKHASWLLQGADPRFNWSYTARNLIRIKRSIKRTVVVCRSLGAMLQRQSTLQPSVLLIDAEGLDCKIVASVDWCVIQPRLIVFERLHCWPHEFLRAQQRLRGVGLACKSPRWRLIAQTDDNVFFRIATDERDQADLLPLDERPSVQRRDSASQLR